MVFPAHRVSLPAAFLPPHSRDPGPSAVSSVYRTIPLVSGLQVGAGIGTQSTSSSLPFAKQMRRCDADYFSAARFGLRIAANPLPVPLWAARIRKFSRPNRARRQSGAAFSFVLSSCLLFLRIRLSDLQWLRQSGTGFTGCCWDRSA
jgi:hypothetical protein